jgi:hypothetical protein
MRRILVGITLGSCALIPALAAHWTPIGYAQTTPAVQSDEFNATSFNAPFVVQCAPQATTPCPDAAGASTWSLDTSVPGFLRIWTLPGTLVGSTTNNARNLVLQPVANAADDYTVTTSLTFPGASAPAASALGQTAGIIVYQDADHFIYLGRSFVPANQGLPQLEFRQEDGSTELVNTVSELSPVHGTVYLRLVKTGSLYQGYYSYDNVNFTQIAPGLAPTPTATATTAPTATATGTVTATTTATATSTSTPAPTATATALPTGYTASYASPQVGLFAWGGTDAAASANIIPADFDWFRAGSNSQTPVVTATGTAVTSTATATATSTVSPTATSTAVVGTIPPLPTNTSTPTATPTSTPVPTNTSIPPVPTATSKPVQPATFGLSWVSAWYHYVRIGDKQHLQAQAKVHSKQAIWVTVTFATGKKIHFWTHTGNNGFWQATVTIPHNTISARSHRAWVTFQLWKGSLTTKRYAPFNVVRR